MKQYTLLLLFSAWSSVAFSQDWADIPVPADAGKGKTWELQASVSDDFNYTFEAVDERADFGEGTKWYNFYHNQWDGPGTTYWKHNHVEVKDGKLALKASRWEKTNQPNPQYPYPGASEESKMGRPLHGVNAGCITSHHSVKYPVYVESAISVANIELASCFWLLSADDTEEIDIIENYGGVDGFKHLTHISHHSFIRKPFHDYQPRDWNSWYPDGRVNSKHGWGDWAWNGGNRQYLRLGVYWKSPFHFEYYIDGELVRVMYYNAIATRINDQWEYTYYDAIHPAGAVDEWGNNVGGMPVNQANGYSAVTLFGTFPSFDFETLQQCSQTSNGIDVIDPGEYQGGNGFTKEMDIIINVESQSWLVAQDKTPTDESLLDLAKNTMLIDWVRVYKPVAEETNISVTDVVLSPTELVLELEESIMLETQFTPANATDQSMDFTSDNVFVAQVNHLGEVTAVGYGTTVITGRTNDGGHTATTIVKVENPHVSPPDGESFIVEAEDFNRTGGTFNDGYVPYGVNRVDGLGVNYVNRDDYMEFDLQVEDAGTYEVTYLISTPSDDAEISLKVDGEWQCTTAVANNGGWGDYVSLKANRLVQFAAGKQVLRIEATGEHDWQWNLDKITFVLKEREYIAVAAVSLGSDSEEMEKDETLPLTATIAPQNASNKVVKWSSSDPAVVTVVGGLVTALADGNATVSVITADGAFTDETKIRVGKPLTVEEQGQALPFEIFPNPVMDVLTIKGDALEGVNLKIVGLNGEKLMEWRAETNADIQLNLSFFKAGIYLLQIHKGQQIHHYKILKN